ncbi:uncharacterized protein [Antedon mediterranea]|uniref:uncharacterized protein n=1 Tax=Antedon mediterranea TaxID=105859 RepID=UPI003AF98A45
MDEMTFIDLMDDTNSVNTDTTVCSEASAADFEDVEENDSLLDLLQDDQNKQQLDVATEEFFEGTAGASGGNKKRKMADTTEEKRQSQTVLKSRKKAKTEEMVAGFSNSLTKISKEFGEINHANQMQLQQNMFAYEDRKRKEEAEEKRRDEERAHERQMQILSMFGQMFAGRQQPAQPLHPAQSAEAGHSGFSQQPSHPARLGYSGRRRTLSSHPSTATRPPSPQEHQQGPSPNASIHKPWL